jgi:hypothetical protein
MPTPFRALTNLPNERKPMMIRVSALSKLPVLVLVIAVGGATLAAQTSKAPAAQTPSQVYMTYRAAFDKATKVDDIKPFQSKAVRAQMDATPAKDRAEFFKMMKAMGAMKSVKVSKETLTPTGATLLVDAINPGNVKMTCEVTLVKEDGAWKVDSENWKQ